MASFGSFCVCGALALCVCQGARDARFQLNFATARLNSIVNVCVQSIDFLSLMLAAFTVGHLAFMVLPLYSLVVQMGDQYNTNMIPNRVTSALQRLSEHKRARHSSIMEFAEAKSSALWQKIRLRVSGKELKQEAQSPSKTKQATVVGVTGMGTPNTTLPKASLKRLQSVPSSSPKQQVLTFDKLAFDSLGSIRDGNASPARMSFSDPCSQTAL